MARSTKLKVFRTAIGFHDAYVAAPSRKAALVAWGSDKDLFARGAAELVEDPALTAEMLASPGKVIRRLRGTAAEQIAALPKGTKAHDDGSSADAAPRRPGKSSAAAKRRIAPAPQPSRRALDEAERALAKAIHDQDERRRALAAREAELAQERTRFEAEAERETGRLRRARDREAARFDAATRRLHR